MEIRLTSEQTVQLLQLAAVEGKAVDDLAGELLGRELLAEARFAAAVALGQQSAKCGDFVEAADVWAGVEAVLQS